MALVAAMLLCAVMPRITARGGPQRCRAANTARRGLMAALSCRQYATAAGVCGRDGGCTRQWRYSLAAAFAAGATRRCR